MDKKTKQCVWVISAEAPAPGLCRVGGAECGGDVCGGPSGVSLASRALWPACLERHQPGGVEQQGVQVLGVDGPVERRLRATPLDFWQQVLDLLDGYQDLEEENHVLRLL